MRKNLAYVLYDFHTGGMETTIYNIASMLREDFDFHFIATHVSDIHDKFKKIGKCVYINNKIDLLNYYKKNNIEIVQVNIEDWYAKIAKKAGVKRVIERTDGDRNCCKSSKKFVDHVIASTKGTVPLIAKQIDKSRISVIYNGINLSKFNKSGEVDRAGISSDRLIIGRVGRLVWGKRVDILIEAIMILKKRGVNNISLLIVGGDSKMPGAPQIMKELKNKAKIYGIEKAVVFVGDVEEPYKMINAFDVCTCISMPKNEGIPNSLLEPMGAGAPAIASDVGDIKELVNDSNGITVPYNNSLAVAKAILSMMDSGKRKRMGEAARQTIKRDFDLNKMIKEYKRIYLGL